MSFIVDLVHDLQQRGLVDPDRVQGCSRDEIYVLMEAQGVSELPRAYVEFLACMGKNPYWLSTSGEWDYQWLLEAKEIAREIVVEDHGGDFAGLEDVFVFQTHQGYIFYYFRSEELGVEDPRFGIFYGNRPLRMSETTFNGWVQGLANYLPTALELRRRYGAP